MVKSYIIHLLTTGSNAPFYSHTRDAGLTWGPIVVSRTLLESIFIWASKKR